MRPVHHPWGITYLYGTLPVDSSGLRDIAARQPHYAIIDEIAGLPANVTRGPLKTSFGGGRWYWEVAFNVRCRNLTIDIITNLRARVVRTIKQAMAGEAGCEPGRG